MNFKFLDFFGQDTQILMDTDATHSFASKEFAKNIDGLGEKLPQPLVVSTPRSENAIVEYVHPKYNV